MWLLTSPFRVARLRSVSLFVRFLPVSPIKEAWKSEKLILYTAPCLFLGSSLSLMLVNNWRSVGISLWATRISFSIRIRLTTTVHLTLMMTSAQVGETSVTTNDNSPSQDYTHPDDQTTLLHYLFRFRVFFSDVLAATLISVFSVWSFSLVVFLCKRDCFAGKNEIWSVSTSLCRARDHNLAGVALITWRSFSLKTHDDFLFQGVLFQLVFIASV